MKPRRSAGMSRGVELAIGIAVALVILGGALWLFRATGIAVGMVALTVAGGALQLARGTKRHGFWIGLLVPVGLVALFVSERVVGSSHEDVWLARGAGLFAIAAAVGWRLFEVSRTRGAARKVEVRLTAATGGVLAALALYVLSTETGIGWLGLEGAAAERTSGALAVLWVALLAVSMGALLFMEMAYRAMPIEAAVELRRVDASAANGLTLALSLIFVVSINYVAQERDVKRDLSYFKTTRPSETTLGMVERLDEPLRVVLFYPRVNEVLDQVAPYFEELDAASDQLSVAVRDHALEPELAERHRVRGNGFVVLLRGEGEGEQAESFEIGVELEAARSRLRTLDGRFQQHFARLTIRPRELYVTIGHRERSASGADGDAREQRLGELTAALQRSNISSRDLGMAQGLGSRVPEGAPAVAVIGPREPFLREEAESLLRYVQGGGRVAIFVDPDVEHGLEPLLHGLGVSLRQGVLHSERSHLRRGEPPADRAVIFANNYSAHPTVTLATRNRRPPAVFDRGGALERREEGQVAGVSVTFPLWASEGYWLDTDGDHAQGAGEPSDARYSMVAAITVPNAGGDEGRAVVIADGDFITDAWIQNAGNAFVLMDTLNWLVGEEQVSGPTQTEEDVPIEHTRDEDKLWFYGTSFALPLPLLILGFWMARRKFAGSRVSEPRDGARTPRSDGELSPSRSREGAGGRAEGEASEEDGELSGEKAEGEAPEGSDDDEGGSR